ncbi:MULTISPECIES: hypothetical protein [Rhizobium]|uniref:Uncharacterized protein n=1 Tax=Rhizobium paranaense TaxID=1650438 RepID=A0A7W9D575_9HYPH|nr:hypothetical protein [Rhizobium paranaense]MBB5577686.1 hypothetical protein [Rhizobium paranaense]
MKNAHINPFRYAWALLATRRPGLRSHPANAPWFRDLYKNDASAVMHRDRLPVALITDDLREYEEICVNLEKELKIYLIQLNQESHALIR